MAKTQDNSNDLIIILYNPTEKESKGQLLVHENPREVFTANLNEEREEKQPVEEGGIINMSLGPKKISALRLSFERSSLEKFNKLTEEFPEQAEDLEHEIPELEDFIGLQMEPSVIPEEVAFEKREAEIYRLFF